MIVHLADAADVLRYVEPGSVDAIVTDPPAGIGLMGKRWDGDRGGRDQWIAWLAGIMRGGLAALRPGGYALVWALPRTSHWTATAVEDAGFEIVDVHHHLFGTGRPASKGRLGPGAEHWIVARKPGPRRGLNIEACRLGTVPEAPGSTPPTSATRHTYAARTRQPYTVPPGRWPKNVSLDEDAAADLDAQAGPRRSPKSYKRGVVGHSHPGHASRAAGVVDMRDAMHGYGDTGSASRFFYVAKCAPSDRTCGGSVGNDHPTVKSRALMRWLVRLVTPPGGLVLDLFAGSGSTALACIDEGVRFVGFENDAQPGAHAIALARIASALAEASTMERAS